MAFLRGANGLTIEKSFRDRIDQYKQELESMDLDKRKKLEPLMSQINRNFILGCHDHYTELKNDLDTVQRTLQEMRNPRCGWICYSASTRVRPDVSLREDSLPEPKRNTPSPNRS